MLRRIVFRQRRQQVGESVNHYVADLRGLASLCKFGALENEPAVDMAFQLESAAGLASQLASSSPSLTQPMPHTQMVGPFVGSPSPGSSQDWSEGNFAGQQGASHPTRALTCPAKGQRCKRCGRQNHFARVCRSVSASTSPAPRSPGPPAPTTIHSVSSTSRPFKVCTVELDGACLPLLLDTGATRSLLNVSTIRRLFPLRTSTAGAEDLYGYGHSKIGMVGTIAFSVCYGTKTLPSVTFQVSRHGRNLMGMDLFCDLGFSFLDYTGSAILSVSSPWQQRWPVLFDSLGCLTAFNHQPLLNEEVRPVIQLRDNVTAELRKLLEAGIINQVNASPWISNLVVARKKSGGLRPCIDLRSVNKAVIPDKYPLPTVEELASKFHGSSVFSKPDLRQGYMQVMLHPNSRDLTAFVSYVGFFTLHPHAFRLSSAPSCFQKIMSTMFAGIPGVVIYLDDIVVHGTTPTLHDECLTRVLDVLTSHNLTLNGEKCIFAVSAVEFVGFRLTADGLSPLHSNVEAVQRLPEPSCPAQLASFQGMTAYYLRFLPEYSATTDLLRELLKKDAAWSWTPACSASVHHLKAQLTSPHVLAHFAHNSDL
ncbi:hypothetical protein F2P81_009571 [Scophthalmus maximus]|uniref:ribonuclease H n=1 Tax=Scophthalmus maximus TaxID=52904 RepID=A0A6A4SZF3_SCOMX|nr:hypothetical protein F2P81_009571 [Scophthalmus maximus]